MAVLTYSIDEASEGARLYAAAVRRGRGFEGPARGVEDLGLVVDDAVTAS